MLDFAQSVWLIGTGIGAACGGVAAIIRADALKIWARRCHPKGIFKYPLLSRVSSSHQTN